ncbi:MAG: hypothetical protein AAGA61_09545, partial [Pseudomonadota bacterium]
MSDLRVDPRNRHDRPSSGGAKGSAGTLIAIVAAVVAALALMYWLFGRQTDLPEPVAEAPSSVTPEPTENLAPVFPVPTPLPERDVTDDLTPLPALDDSDRYFELSLSNILGPGIVDLLVDSALIEKFVAT